MLTGLLRRTAFVTNFHRNIHVTSTCQKSQSGKYKVTRKHNRSLTYEQANPPYQIGHRKSWNSWNTCNLWEALRASETAVEDLFIRKFIFGTWHRLFLSEVIIKRRHNIIYIGGLINRNMRSTKLYFLIGYTEEILSYIFKCPIKMELQSVQDKTDVIIKYI